MKVKIIDQAEGMNLDLFEEVVNLFLAEAYSVIHIRITTIKDFRLRATIIYRPKPEVDGNRV